MQEYNDEVLDNCSESIVFVETGYSNDFLLGPGYTFDETHSKLASGFFVAPNMIVTTIGVLAGSVKVSALSVGILEKIIADKTEPVLDQFGCVQYYGEHKYTIEGVAGFDPKNNLVVLKTKETQKPLQLGNSETVQLDDPIYTLGFDADSGIKCTQGTFQSRYNNDKWLQIKSEYISGYAGGPILNTKKEVIGVTAYGNGSITGGDMGTVATGISSKVLRELLVNTEKVIPLERFLKLARIRAYALQVAADLKVESDDDRGALRDYNAALKLNSELYEIYSKRGLMKTRIGNWEGAVRDYDKMLKVNPRSVFMYNNRGTAKATLGDRHGALDDLKKAVELEPEYILAYTNLGGVNMYLGDDNWDMGNIVEARRFYQDAIDTYTKSLELKSNNLLVRKYRRLVKRKLKRLKSDGNTK